MTWSPSRVRSTNALSEVPLQLIREGATLIRDVEDLLGDLGVEIVPAEVAERLELDDAERRILDGIAEPTLPDRLASSLGLAIPEVVGVLMRLELRGFVRNVGGRYETTLKARAQRDEANERSAAGHPTGREVASGGPRRRAGSRPWTCGSRIGAHPLPGTDGRRSGPAA